MVEKWQLNLGHVRSWAAMKKLLLGCCKLFHSSLSSQTWRSYVECMGLSTSVKKKTKGAARFGIASILCPKISTTQGALKLYAQ
jgi:hypothetical protein